MTDPRDALAEDIFMALIGSPTGSYYEDETEIRSAPYSPTVDVKLGEQWYRVSASPIEEPISVEEHRNGVVARS